MTASIFAHLTFACVVVAPVFALAAKNAELSPPPEHFDKLRIEDHFDGKQLDSIWTVTKGSWEIAGGELVGREKADDKHAAVLTLNQPNRNSAIKFSFQLDGANSLSFSMNRARGHLFRVVVRDDAVVIMKDKDKRDPQSRVKQLAKAPAIFEPGVWYTMLVVMNGDEVAVRTDNDVNLTARDAQLNVEKPNYRFVIRGQSVAIDDVQVWDTKN